MWNLKKKVQQINKSNKKGNRLTGTENPWGEGRREGQAGRLKDTSYKVWYTTQGI